MATTTSPATRPTARSTTIALKMVMAVTGAIFALFVLAHMYGNLKLLWGEEAYNDYAHHLRTIGEPMLPYAGLLWVLRIVLLVSLVAHLWAAFTLWGRAERARSHKYAVKKRVRQSLSSRWMRWGGVFIFVFLVWHLIEFTIVRVDVSGKPVPDNPFQLVVDSFQVWWLTLIYVVAMLALYMHLAHGVFSLNQTLGWTNTKGTYARAKVLGHVVAAVVVVGFLIPPLAVLFRLVK
ncbi:succinate dehydrogenase cytochrome b subunit [Nostocoides japonicum]|nr:succinate dehydrogenase cytochrome b subunit [Tetrasphaera japonica]